MSTTTKKQPQPQLRRVGAPSARPPVLRPTARLVALAVAVAVAVAGLPLQAAAQAATPAATPATTPAATPASTQTAAPAPTAVDGLVRSVGNGLSSGADALVQLLQPSPPERQQAPATPPAPAAQAESLPALLARMLAAEPQVRVAQALLQATQERRLQARSRLGPSLGLNLSKGASNETEIINGAVDRSTNRAEATLRWNLYNAGNDLAELNGASRDVDAAAQDVRRAREDTAERLAETYTDLLRLQTLLPFAQARLAAVQRLTDQLRQQNAAGRASDADALQAATSLLDAQILLDQFLSDEDSARQKLIGLVGGEVRAVLPLDLPPVVLPSLAADGVDGGNINGLNSAAQIRAESARLRVRPSTSLLAPRIDLELRKQLSDRTVPALTTQQQQVWLVTARWDFPVLGENNARRAEAERRAEAAEAEGDRVARGARAELQSLGPRIANAERSLLQIDQQLTQYTALVRAGDVQFEAGRRTVAQLISLRESRFSAEQRRVEQAHRLLGARLRVLALTGKLLPAMGLGTGLD